MIKIVALGGLTDVGHNCLAIRDEHGKILVIDAGFGFDKDRGDGPQTVSVPDFSWLVEREADILGILVTHGHMDHVGGLPHLLKQLSPKLRPKIFFPRFAYGLIAPKLEGRGHVFFIEPRTRFDLNGFTIEALRVTHSIPDSYALAVSSSAGTVIHTGDFKVEDDPQDGEAIDRERFEEYGANGGCVLLSDSTNSESTGLGERREEIVGRNLLRVIRGCAGRVFVTCFSSNTYRLQSIIVAARTVGRKVCFLGNAVEQTAQIARKLKRLSISPGELIDEEGARKLKSDQVLYIVTGSQGEEGARLNRFSRSTFLREGDNVIFSSRIIPGNELVVEGLIKRLRQTGARVTTVSEEPGIHSSGHATPPEQAQMIKWTNPGTLIPIHGHMGMRTAHAQLGVSLGVNPLLLEDGLTAVMHSTQEVRLGDRVPVGIVPIIDETPAKRTAPRTPRGGSKRRH